MTDDAATGDTGTGRSSRPRGGVAGARIALAATAGLLTALDLALKAWARGGLTGGRVVEWGIVDLRLAFNPGVAFSFGAELPAGVVLGVTGVVLAGLVVVAWRAAAGGPAGVRWALAVVLGGAVANFVDRAIRGAVTDYLHTGWFPTFNLADVFITLGGVALVLASLRAERGRPVATEGAA